MQTSQNFDSLIELMDYFDREEKCIAYYQQIRWKGTPVCPHCESDKIYKFSDGKRFKCGNCRKHFTVRVGTIYQDSNVSLRKWFMATYLTVNNKKGISARQLARHIKVTPKTALFMLHRLRHKFGVENDPNEQLSGIVEVDETFVGGKNKNRHWDKKVEKCQGRSFKDKTPILGLVQRKGKVKTVVIPNTSTEIIQPLVQQMVKDNSFLVTDEWSAYNGLDANYQHSVINHGKGQYGHGLTYTNNIEGFWAWIKRMIMGVYHQVTRKYLQLYAHEATYRYNTRKMRDCERWIFSLSLKHTPLKYKQLTAKAA